MVENRRERDEGWAKYVVNQQKPEFIRKKNDGHSCWLLIVFFRKQVANVHINEQDQLPKGYNFILKWLKKILHNKKQLEKKFFEKIKKITIKAILKEKDKLRMQKGNMIRLGGSKGVRIKQQFSVCNGFCRQVNNEKKSAS